MRRVSVIPFVCLALAGVIAALWGGQIVTAAPLQQELVPLTIPAAPAEQSSANLPAPLYYIEAYSGQIVRLSSEGGSRRTITRETAPVVGFDVSPDGSKLAYVSGNRLVETDANGLNPVVKFAGPALNTLDSENLTVDRVGVPVYAPAGERIAFAYNGVNVVASGPDAGPDAVNYVLPSDPFPTEPEFSSSALARFYSPRAWGPDGVHLVVDVSYFPEGFGLAILAPDSNILVDLTADSADIALSGDVAWKSDSTGFFIGSAALAYGTPGLSLADAGSGAVTGVLTSPVSFDGSTTPLYLVRGPHVAADGGLLAFVSAQEVIDTSGVFALEKVDPANGERTAVNEQAYPWPESVLWARDDSGAILLTDVTYTDTGANGLMQWAPVNGEAVTLGAYGSSPRWGSRDFEAPPPEANEVIALFEQSLDLAAVQGTADSPVFGPSVAFPVEGEDGVTYWIAHTTELRSFNPDVPHAVGVYVREDDGWREVGLLELTGAQEGVTAGPDYLNENGIMPVQIGSAGEAAAGAAGDAVNTETQLWLHVEGGAGAHSGVCAILRLAGDTLTQELDGFNPSPGACEVQDVNGDGNNEVVLNATDPYVFCYACGVRFIDYGVQRWDGRQFVAVNLESLPAAASPELDSRNEEMLRMVQGGLWKGALDLANSPITAGSPVLANSAAVTGTETTTATAALTASVTITTTETTTPTAAAGDLASDPSGVYAWNTALVRLVGEARRAEAERSDHPYPLLAQVFYGDYPAAVDVMRVYSASEIFAQPSSLISGTVAVGWESTLADWITTTTSSAIDVNPQLATAYFVRGWGEWLAGVTSVITGDVDPTAAPTTDVAIAPLAREAAIADIRRALELSPDPFYAESLSLLTGEEVSLPAAPVSAAITSTTPVTATQLLTATTPVSPTATATATATTGAGRIFYSTVQDGVDRIYTLEFGVQNATLSEVLDQARQPALQPGGQRLAYQSTRSDMLGLGAFDLDTGNRFNFTTNLEDSLPRWNPEGNRLAFSSTRYGDGRSRVYLAWAQAAEFATEEALDLGEGSDPDWSPDGARLVYKGCDAAGANCGLWTMALDGTDRRQLTTNAGDARPRWSPDGSRVVFMSDGRSGNWDVYSVAVDGGGVTQISFNAASDGLPAVSPDGSAIVFVSNRGNQWGIWRVSIASGRAESVVGDLGALPNWLDQSLDWVP